MLGIYGKAISGWCHARGLFALNAGRLERAERFLRESIKQGERVRSPLLPETYLLLADTVAKRGRRDEAAELFHTGLVEVQRSGSYSADDEKYLRNYFSLLLGLPDQKDALVEFNASSVRRGLLRDFPITERTAPM